VLYTYRIYTNPKQLKSNTQNRTRLPKELKDSLVFSHYSCHAMGYTSSYKDNNCATKCVLYKYDALTATSFSIHTPPSASVHHHILNLEHIIQYICVHFLMMGYECQNILEKIEHTGVTFCVVRVLVL